MKDKIHPSNSADVILNGKTYKTGIITTGDDAYRLKFNIFRLGYDVYWNDRPFMMTPFNNFAETKSFLFHYLLDQSDMERQAQEEGVAK